MNSEKPKHVEPWGSKLKRWGMKAATMVLLGLACAWFYSWGSKKFYSAKEPAGFGYGVMHGALLPMALPSLLVGDDPEIFAKLNTGRSYKLGYIAGINMCGFVVFGVTFWSPKKRGK